MDGPHHFFGKVQVVKTDFPFFRRDREFRWIPRSFMPARLGWIFCGPRLPRRTLCAVGTFGARGTFRAIRTFGAGRTFRAVGTLGTGRTLRASRTVGTVRTGGTPFAAIPLARGRNRTLGSPFAGKTGTLGNGYDRRDGGSSPRASHLLEQIPEFFQDECCH
jgi:hypothetical protein